MSGREQHRGDEAADALARRQRNLEVNILTVCLSLLMKLVFEMFFITVFFF